MGSQIAFRLMRSATFALGQYYLDYNLFRAIIERADAENLETPTNQGRLGFFGMGV